MTQTKQVRHTALPWIADGFTDNGTWRIKAGTDDVCYVVPAMPKSDDEVNANVDIIVKAVNSHEELLGALERLIDDHDQGLSFDISWSNAKQAVIRASVNRGWLDGGGKRT